ncbi:alpha/beta hydrolase [Mesorhizobium sp.]|uniref:alpha/beta fold hydrolase n=1 Tax=Mesorhizobium sp. TaxID=1871066 RepID=UPI0025DC5047|nr:alpha/beta hydrolase [Mesorhizobium sp.]
MPKQRLSLLAGTIPLAISDEGKVRTFLLLHGGAGAGSMAGLAQALARSGRAIVPTHPGFDGEPRPEAFSRIADLALAYLALIDRLDLKDVVLIGNSAGGWIGAEMALRNSPSIAGLILLNAVGIDPDPAGQPIVDPTTLPPTERAAFAFHDPQRYALAPAGPDAIATMAENQRNLRLYSGEHFMHDPALRARLARMPVPAAVVWGESDRIVDIGYGRRYADSIAGAEFHGIAEAGHFPHVERLDAVVGLVERFAGRL